MTLRSYAELHHPPKELEMKEFVLHFHGKSKSNKGFEQLCHIRFTLIRIKQSYKLF